MANTPTNNPADLDTTENLETVNYALELLGLKDTVDLRKLSRALMIIDGEMKAQDDKVENLTISPVGGIMPYAGAVAPANWLICDGSTFDAVTYPELNTLLGGNVLPDLRGEFIRGLDNGRGIDPDRTLGSWQEDEFKAHKHRIYSGAVGSYNGPDGNAYRFYNGDHDSEEVGGSETRPRNVAFNYIIKAK